MPAPSPIPPRSPASRRGLTLLEVTLGMSILAVGLLALTSTSVATHKLRETDHARQLARDGLAAVVRDVEVASRLIDKQSADWSAQLLARFSGAEAWRAVDGLDPWPDQPGVIELRFFPDETIGDDELGFPLGLPRDLDNDGFASSPDVSDSARLLPAVARARWTTNAGDRELVQGFFVMGY
jgi:prepilin-type N-terminal cleavage/methylation domain-containing protein